MTNIQLYNKAIEIANLLFASTERYISRSEFNNHLQEDYMEYGDIIREALCSISKISKQQGRTGGIKYDDGPYRRSLLTQNEMATIKKKVEQLLAAQIDKAVRTKPEHIVEKAFESWLEQQEDFLKHAVIQRFRSEAKRASKWQNVDGYSIAIEKSRYHISFKPIFTTFEVKAIIPNVVGFSQAKNYLKFSHYVYMVFRFEGSSEDLKKALKDNKFDLQDGIGIFYTTDGIKFEQLYEAKLNTPSEKELEDAIGILLSENDKETLLKYKYQYLVEDVLIPAIS